MCSILSSGQTNASILMSGLYPTASCHQPSPAYRVAWPVYRSAWFGATASTVHRCFDSGNL